MIGRLKLLQLVLVHTVHELYIMLPCENEITDLMDDMQGYGYKEMYMRQVVAARDAIYAEMCKVLNTQNHDHVQRRFLDKPHITKATLIRWLETVCFILDRSAVPLLRAGQEIFERIGELREEKIDDQDTIIHPTCGRLLSGYFLFNAYFVACST